MIKFKLFQKSKILHGISEKKDGNVDLRFSSQLEVTEHIKNTVKKINMNSQDLVQAEQVHGTRVAPVTKSDRGKVISKADGLITDQSDVVLMLRLADCIPAFLFDPPNQALGLIHTGWRGTIGKIVLVAIQKMMLQFNTNPNKLLIALGPSIKPCCNLVKKSPLQLELPEWKPFIKKENGQYSVDLSSFVAETAIKAGVKRENIEISKRCTVMDNNLFSFKRSKDTGEKEGRFTALLGLRK